MSKFICITFGPSDIPNQFWNECTNWERQKAAENWGLQSLGISGVFGYIIIKEGEDYWEVVDEVGAPENAVSISCNRVGTFKVQPVSQLVTVA